VKSRGVVEPVHVWDLAAEFVAEVIPEFARLDTRVPFPEVRTLADGRSHVRRGLQAAAGI
jgi:hypothetical protein